MNDFSRAVVEEARAQTVEALTRALALHDYRRGMLAENEPHFARVTELGLRLATQVAPALARQPSLAYGFRLHDIGMLGVSNKILQKQGPLTPDEIDEVREHPLLGERIVAPVAFLAGIAREVVGGHHERWDGTGYPRGLAGTSIPLAARIFSIVDAFDSLTHEQPYRRPLSEALAIEEIERQSGSQFDPELVPRFVAVVTA